MERLYTFENFISEEDCTKIINLCNDTLTLSEGRVGVGSSLKKIRNSLVAFIKNIDLVDEKLLNVLKENIKLKGFELTGLGEYQFTKYGVGQFYDWHMDSGSEFINRYYSVVIQLNSEYEGGILEIENSDKTILKMKPGLGHMYIFQSDIRHRVTPVIEGTRYSLVNWVSVNKIDSFKKTLL